jgi:hypothetical protein
MRWKGATLKVKQQTQRLIQPHLAQTQIYFHQYQVATPYLQMLYKYLRPWLSQRQSNFTSSLVVASEGYLAVTAIVASTMQIAKHSRLSKFYVDLRHQLSDFYSVLNNIFTPWQLLLTLCQS